MSGSRGKELHSHKQQQHEMRTSSHEDERPVWAEPSTDSSYGSMDRTSSRRRSLQCTEIDVRIADTQLTDGHTMYIIEVSSGVKQWTVIRRFKDFYFLDKLLRKNFPKIKIPPLPPKRYFASSTEPGFVDNRREQLEEYLQTLIRIQSIWTRNDLVLFLNNAENNMMFVWNFERMRRMQDMLSSMKLENETETSKISSDLVMAKSQVTALQERLARMEMLLLQQVTGLASEELSPAAIRSLSGVDKTISKKLQAEVEEDLNSISASLERGSITPPSAANYSRAPSTPDSSAGAAFDQSILEEAIDRHVSSGQKMPPEEVIKVLNNISSPTALSSYTTPQQTPESTSGLTKLLNKSGLASSSAKTPEEIRTMAVSMELRDALRISKEVLAEKMDVTELTPDSARKSLRASVSEDNLTARLSILPPRVVTGPKVGKEVEIFEYNTNRDSGDTWRSLLVHEVDGLLNALTPNATALHLRYQIFRYIRTIVSSSLGIQLFAVGNLVSHTFLPETILGATAFIAKPKEEDEDPWFVRLNEALCMSAFQKTPDHRSGHNEMPNIIEMPDGVDDVIVSNISFVNQDGAKSIKMTVNNLTVDISMNEVGSLYSQLLIEKLDEFVAQDHLFKRSLVLVLAWCYYESGRHTHGLGSIASNISLGINTSATTASHMHSTQRLSDWTIAILLTWVFNKEGRRISHPIQALGHFLATYAGFDWNRYAVTVFGLVPAATGVDAECIPEEPSTIDNIPDEKFFPHELLEKYFFKEHLSEESTDTAVDIPDKKPDDPVDQSSKPLQSQSKEMEATTSTAEGEPVVKPAPRQRQPICKPMVTGNSFESNTYMQGLMCVVDPAVPRGPNITVSIDAEGYQAITNAFQGGFERFQALCNAFSELPPETIESARLSQRSSSNDQQDRSSLTAVLTSIVPDQDVLKAMKLLFLNTQLKVVALSVPSTLDSRGASKNPSTHSLVAQDMLAADFDDLEFSLRYAELTLGGRVDKDFLVHMIVQIIKHKGKMPVGEVGKNIQAITGCENLSKRLKEQYSGLKRAIENCNSPRILVGNEHPFNPFVSLNPDYNEPLTQNNGLPNPFNHADFVFTPILAAAAASNCGATVPGIGGTSNAPTSQGSATGKGASSGGGTSARSFRRQPPSFNDNRIGYHNKQHYRRLQRGAPVFGNQQQDVPIGYPYPTQQQFYQQQAAGNQFYQQQVYMQVYMQQQYAMAAASQQYSGVMPSMNGAYNLPQPPMQQHMGQVNSSYNGGNPPYGNQTAPMPMPLNLNTSAEAQEESNNDVSEETDANDQSASVPVPIPAPQNTYNNPMQIASPLHANGGAHSPYGHSPLQGMSPGHFQQMQYLQSQQMQQMMLNSAYQQAGSYGQSPGGNSPASFTAYMQMADQQRQLYMQQQQLLHQQQHENQQNDSNEFVEEDIQPDSDGN